MARDFDMDELIRRENEATVDFEFCQRCLEWHSPKSLCKTAQPRPIPVAIASYAIPENWTEADVNRITGEVMSLLAERGLLKAEPNEIN